MATSSTSSVGSSASIQPLPQDDLKTAFQKTTAGLVFGEMLKAMRQSAGETAYLNGGNAEKMFQSQLDQHVADLAAEHQGGPMSERLFLRFQAGLNAQSPLLAAARDEAVDLVQGDARSADSAGSRARETLGWPSQASQPLQPVQQAQSAREARAGTIGVDGLLGLLRK